MREAHNRAVWEYPHTSTSDDENKSEEETGYVDRRYADFYEKIERLNTYENL